jgi:hypothetical protein
MAKPSPETIVSIVSAILGSSLILGAITALFSEVINAPKLIQSKPIEIPNTNGDITGISVEVRNDGRSAAKNLYLTVVSNIDVDYRPFSTENMTILTDKDDHRTLIAYFPRFIHGAGSLVKIDMTPVDKTGTTKMSSKDYHIDAVYDQGSLVMRGDEEPSSPIGMTVLFTVAGIIVFFIPYFYKRVKQYNLYLAAELIFENILHYKQHFEKNNSDNEVNEEAITLSENIVGLEDSFKGVKSGEQDFTTIQDFYSKLHERNTKLRDMKEEMKEKIKKKPKSSVDSDPEVAKKATELNNCVIEAAKKAEDIDWTKYRVNTKRVSNRMNRWYYTHGPTITWLSYYSGIHAVWQILRPVAAVLIIPLVLSIGLFIMIGDPFKWIHKFNTLEIELLILAGGLAIIAYMIVRPELRVKLR